MGTGGPPGPVLSGDLDPLLFSSPAPPQISAPHTVAPESHAALTVKVARESSAYLAGHAILDLPHDGRGSQMRTSPALRDRRGEHAFEYRVKRADGAWTSWLPGDIHVPDEPCSLIPSEVAPALDPATLDPRIRRLVMHLRALGIPTSDSGDGVSKPADERALDVPHVFAVYPRLDWRRAVADADRVGALLPAREGSEISLAYNPHDQQLVLAIVGYGDGDLP